MARAAGKKTPKAQTTPSPAQPFTTTDIPTPFQPVPTSLRAFVSTLPTDHVFLAHLDRTPIDLKRRVFMVPVLLNAVIILILCVRIYYAAPVYLQQIITIFGYETPWTVDTDATSTGDLVSTVSSRTFLLMIDYAFFVLLGSWPREFIFGSKTSRFVGALDWRWTLSFQKTEIIVRRGRKWDGPVLAGVAEGDAAWGPQEELTVKYKIEPAMRKAYTSKTGYLLLDKDWDLDFRGIVDAHRFATDGRVKLADLEEIALVFYNKQWLVWKVHDSIKPVITNEVEEQKLQNFKTKLTDLGLEDVFFRWIEIVQYETSRPGGFTRSRRDEALDQLKKLVEERDVSYPDFWKDLGGEDALPGFGES